ncbi:hypothetical protein [Desulforamulus ruminis]|uniref:Uncharacterized protein n=1 Tax=Desulforamulus ruminis (strain ATCC 23193 / DSM 2154 / NCIMB 8452 / DL) TaxID=696281 RepID=F6DTV7_DESRL|nr:hypothetical protein [Desulforamulus ruminis]AEG58975.1 hypothetical protein Desru_0690 [Desulforamulus ruminis DSM 2154]
MNKGPEAVHLSERMEGLLQGHRTVFGSTRQGMSFCTGISRLTEDLKDFESLVITDPKIEWMRDGIDGKRQDFYLALAGLVMYGGRFKAGDKNLSTMMALEYLPIEQLNQIFKEEHRSGKLPVFFYEHWQKYRRQLMPPGKGGDKR